MAGDITFIIECAGTLESKLVPNMQLESIFHEGAQWLSRRGVDLRCWFETHRSHCIVSLSKTLNPPLSTGSI